MEGQENDVLDLSNFDFTPVGTKMVGEKIRDTPTSEPLGHDQSQISPLSQGPLSIPPPPSQDLTFLEKGSTTPLPQVIEIEEKVMEEVVILLFLMLPWFDGSLV